MGVNSSFSFNLDVYDKPRLLNEKIVYEVEIGNMKVFKLPVVEEFGPITMIQQNLPPFAKFAYPEYKIYPNNRQCIGTYVIDATVSNKYASK